MRPTRLASARSGLLVAALVSIAVPRGFQAQQAARDYPQWRGRARDGAASDFVAPAAWPKALTRRWRVDVGDGYATPLIVGDRVYVFSRRDGQEVVLALDAATGTERWASRYPAPYTPGAPAAAHGAGPKATPIVHDDAIFTLGISGILSAFDAGTGTRRWQTAAPEEAPFFGAASSPLVEQGLVIVHPGNYGPLTAFEARTGAVRWTAGGEGFFASPLAVTLDGVRQIVTVTQQDVIGVALDGRMLWRQAWNGGTGSTTPVQYQDTIIVSGLDQGVGAFRPRLRDGVWSVETVWQTKDVSMYTSDPVVAGGVLFGLSHRARGQYFAVDAATGASLWLGAPRQAEHTAVVAAGSVLFLLNDNAELVVATASRRGVEPITRYTVADGATWAQPAISGNRLLIRDGTGVALWTVE